MNYLRDGNYIAILDFMSVELKLRGRELMIYSIIYGFSQDGESWFTGSLEYLAQWTNVSRKDNVLKYLKSLLRKGLIEKETRTSSADVRYCAYRVTSHLKKKAKSIIYITPEMLKLKLKANELITYALIYRHSSPNSDSWFNGSNWYISQWLNVNKTHVNRCTSALLKAGLIERIEEQHITKYKVVLNGDKKREGSNNNSNNDGYSQFEYPPAKSKEEEKQGITKMSTPLTNLSTPLTKMSTNNKDNNIDNNVDNKYVVVDEETFVAKCNDSISRINEAYRSTELTNKVIEFVVSTINDTSLKIITSFNSLSATSMDLIFHKALDVLKNDCEQEIKNKRGLLVNFVKRKISLEVKNENTEC